MRQTNAPAALATRLQFLKGVGPQRAKQLERKGLRTVEDALFFLPLRHEDRTRLTPFAALTPGHGPPTQAYWRVLDAPAHPLEDHLLARNSGTRRSTTARQSSSVAVRTPAA